MAIQNGHKLVGQNEWFIMCTCTAKHESTDDFDVVTFKKFTFFTTYNVAVFLYAANNSF